MKAYIPIRPNFPLLYAKAVDNAETTIINRLELDYAIACNLGILAAKALATLDSDVAIDGFVEMITNQIGKVVEPPVRPQRRVVELASIKNKEEEDDDSEKEIVI